MDYSRINLLLGQSAQCSPEEKEEHCLPLVRQVVALARRAQHNGLMDLEWELDDVRCPTLREGLKRVLEGYSPEEVEAALAKQMSFSGEEGVRLLCLLLGAEGALALGQGLRPDAVERALLPLLGEGWQTGGAAAEAEEGAVPEDDSPGASPDDALESSLQEYVQKAKAMRLQPGFSPALAAALACGNNWDVLQRDGWRAPASIAGFLWALDGAGQVTLLHRMPLGTAARVAALLLEEDSPHTAESLTPLHSRLVGDVLRLADNGEVWLARGWYDELDALTVAE